MGIAKNSLHYTFIKILTGSDLSKRRMPYMHITSPSPGPVVWLTGCMHGDEIGGTVTIHEIFKKLRNGLQRGAVHAFPLMNPFGFESISRFISYSKEDLNRSFPGNEHGTLAERMAATVFTKIVESKPALVIDLHNDWKRSIPYALFDKSGIEQIDQEVIQYTHTCGLLQIQDTDNIRSSLTYNLMKQHIPAVVLELGESYVINEQNILIGMNAIWNMLSHLDMVIKEDTGYTYPLPDQAISKPLIYSSLPYSSTSGIIRFTKKPGELVQQGQLIAKIFNAYGKQIETIRALKDGLIIAQSDTALAFPGSPIFASGHFQAE